MRNAEGVECAIIKWFRSQVPTDFKRILVAVFIVRSDAGWLLLAAALAIRKMKTDVAKYGYTRPNGTAYFSPRHRLGNLSSKDKAPSKGQLMLVVHVL